MADQIVPATTRLPSSDWRWRLTTTHLYIRMSKAIQIDGFGEAIKVAAIYDESNPIRCPVCGKLGIRWGGWFTCDSTGDHIVLLSTKEVFVRVK